MPMATGQGHIYSPDPPDQNTSQGHPAPYICNYQNTAGQWSGSLHVMDCDAEFVTPKNIHCFLKHAGKDN